jgi:tryptophan synthase alpha chain
MNRIDKRFAELKKNKKKALIAFITAGDPSIKRTEALIPALEKEGVDLIEIGVPFSDPLADGPVIQAASTRALAGGVNLSKILAMVGRVREKTSLPLLLMSYLNPIWNYGLEEFAKAARTAGVDGVIIPELPPDEGKEIAKIFRKAGLDLVYLLAPTSPAKRQRLIARASTGFIYFVSVTGVTGVRRNLSSVVLKQVAALRKKVRRPVCIGFGVSTPDQARQAARSADGVIVGSAIVRAFHENRKLGAAAFAKRFVRPLALALGKKT